jgi:hypothetical protein
LPSLSRALEHRRVSVTRDSYTNRPVGHHDIARAYAWSQREWMMRDSWGQMAVKALETLTSVERVVTIGVHAA